MYSPAAAMYAAAAGYPGYIGYPVQYYPCYPAAAVQPSIQPLRPTIMIPVSTLTSCYGARRPLILGKNDIFTYTKNSCALNNIFTVKQVNYFYNRQRDVYDLSNNYNIHITFFDLYNK